MKPFTEPLSSSQDGQFSCAARPPPQLPLLLLLLLLLLPLLLRFPQVVQRLRIYTPLLATAAVVMIVGSMISTNVPVVSRSGFAIVTAVLTLHSCGFGLGFFISKGLGLSDKVCRTNAIEVRGGWLVCVTASST
jgi:BASS family bile acid:Na+ symporter